MKTYKTSQIAEKCGVHPNTVRLYEELGFIPPVPRAGNGYRLYSQLHLEHVLLVRTTLKSTWLGGIIRQKALSVLHLSAAGNHDEAIQEARNHLELVKEEREKAEIAAGYLEAWAAAGDDHAVSTRPYRRTKEAAEQLDISQDMLRSWERNGLITVPRDPDNPPDGEDIFYHTDQWLTKIRTIEEAAHEMIDRLFKIKKLHKQ